jgi:hypothetical protein
VIAWLVTGLIVVGGIWIAAAIASALDEQEQRRNPGGR